MWIENTAVVFTFYIEFNQTGRWTSATCLECAISWCICRMHLPGLRCMVLLPDAVLVEWIFGIVNYISLISIGLRRLHEDARVGIQLDVYLLGLNFIWLFHHLNPCCCIVLQSLHSLTSFIARIDWILLWHFYSRREGLLVVDNVSFKFRLFSSCAHRLSDGSERSCRLDDLVVPFLFHNDRRRLWPHFGYRNLLHRTSCTWLGELRRLIRRSPSGWLRSRHCIETVRHALAFETSQMSDSILLGCTVTDLVSSYRFR